MTSPLNSQSVNRLRIAAALFGVAFAFAVVAVVVFLPGGDRSGPPPAILSAQPADGAVVTDADPIEIRLADGVEAVMFLDGVQLELPGTSGLLTWQPGPGQQYETWPSGIHTVEVRFTAGTAGVYRFTFSTP
ncbi:MAG: hypothetical protein HKN07_06325 [Acidimicrobiia bacterium]|nr:hypothetical protein [Acidimicrobiia bacterium]NNF63857.1 hypothetical protein [Acidimicrobiia bacterium]